MSSQQHTTKNKQQQQPQHNDNPEETGGEKVAASTPSFRFVQMQKELPKQSPHLISTTSLKPPPPTAAGVGGDADDDADEIIDTKSYFAKANASASQKPPISAAAAAAAASSGGSTADAETNWVPKNLRPVPAFYPLEKSSRLVEDDTPGEVATRISNCLRTLSVHAVYNDEAATAHLYTSENVEMHLSLWRTNPANGPDKEGVVVELQRRKGDSIAFHRYSRSILDAALGELDPRDLPPEMLDDMMYSKKVQRLLSMELKNRDSEEHENAVIAMEIAHGLLMKDRMDARQLGLESLCLLTDPRKTGYITALLTSHVVLLGTTQGVEIPGLNEDPPEGPFQEIRETILGLIQFSRIGEDEEEEVDEMDLSSDSEHMKLLHNLGLAVLANALDVIENPERYDDEPEVAAAAEEDDAKPRARLRTASSTDVTNDFLKHTDDFSDKEIMSSLINELGKAGAKPHNATLSAKCLGSLCRASDEAKKRAKELGAKTVVSTALDVGTRTHLKLENECKKVIKELERPPRDDEGQQQQERRR